MHLRSLIALVLGFSLYASAAVSAPWSLDPDATKRIEALFNAHDRKDSPGYVIGVVRDGEIVFSRSYGMANLDHAIPLSPTTSFHLASLSKQFTAAAAALLIRDGKLSLEDPIGRWVPQAAKYGPELKIKHLIYMTSGLPEYWDRPRPGNVPWQSFHYFDIDDMLAAATSLDQLQSAPGTSWKYTNTNYLLLAKAVEAASGKPLADLLEERVFSPLNMQQAHLDDDTTLVVPGRATGYIRRDAGLQAEGRKVDVKLRAEGGGWARLNRVSPHYGGSGVFASLVDLAKWDRNWYAETVGGPGFTALMHTTMNFAHPKANDAFGLVRDDRYGMEMWAYSGGDLDASSYMARFPAQRLTVICLSNMPTGASDQKCRAMLDVLNERGLIRS